MIKLRDILKEFSGSTTHYHVSTEEYNKGDVIEPYFNATKYADSVVTNVDSKMSMKFVDDLLSKAKPSTAAGRANSIFVFKSKSDAKQYVKDMPGNRKIYSVTSLDTIVYRDMNWIDYIFGKVVQWGGGRGVSDSKEIPDYALKNIKRHASDYWNGKSATTLTSRYSMSKPKWEGITNNPVTVVEKI